MIQISVRSLDDLNSFFKKFEKLMAEINNEISENAFNPRDPAALEQAVAKADAVVNERLKHHADNPLITGIAAEIKETVRQGIRAQANAFVSSQVEDRR